MNLTNNDRLRPETAMNAQDGQDIGTTPNRASKKPGPAPTSPPRQAEPTQRMARPENSRVSLIPWIT